MATFSLSLFITAVLLGTTAADWKCIMDAKKSVLPEQLFVDPQTACWDLETKFKRTRQELRQCLDYELDISNLESLFYEFCTKSSDFHEKVPRHYVCITRNILRLFQCSDTLKNTAHPLPFQILTKSWRSRAVFDSCQRVSSAQSNCTTHKVGGPCGIEAMEVFGRMQVAAEPFLTGACLSIAKSVVENSEFVNEMTAAEEEEVDSFLSEIEQNRGHTTEKDTDRSALKCA